MNSSEPATSPDKPPQRLADIVGTFIALITLTLPIFVIAHYSSSRTEVLQQVTYPIPDRRE